jgi:glucosamine--fructose-6-phosphate aminotransferase (isomerizing)
LIAAKARYGIERTNKDMKMTHFFKDIQRQPEALRSILASAIGERRNSYREAANLLSRDAALYIVGMGASWHAGMAVASFFNARKRPAVLFDAAELLYHSAPAENASVLLLSRSGKSKELVDLARELRSRNATIISITNDPQSPMALESDCVIGLQSQFDRNVSVTMYSGIALAGCLLAAVSCGEEIHQIVEELDRALVSVKGCIAEWVQRIDKSDWLAVDAPYYFLARGASVSTCNEARLLWEEAAKSTATAMTTSSFRHGPQEMVRKGLRVAIWLDKDHLQHHDLKLASDLRTLGAKVLLIGQQVQESPGNVFLEIPIISSEWQFVIDIMPIQIAAERLARRAGRDCDSFRLCSYIVTDEGGLSLSSPEQGLFVGGAQ